MGRELAGGPGIDGAAGLIGRGAGGIHDEAPARRSAAKASASISSAIGDRQMFPVQTVMIRYWLDVEVIVKHG